MFQWGLSLQTFQMKVGFVYVVNKLDACSKNKTWILKRKYEGKHYPHNCHVKLSIPYSENMSFI